MTALRIKHKHFVGDDVPGDQAAHADSHHALKLSSRCHANFLENVPIAILIATIAELNGANKKALNYGLAVLLFLRVMHVEMGLLGASNAVGIGRPIGYFGTQAWLAGFATYSTYLVKGYWGY